MSRGKAAATEAHRELKREMRSRGITDEDIDSLLGLKSGGFRKQRSRSALRFDDLVNILDFLQVDPDDFFGGVAALRGDLGPTPKTPAAKPRSSPSAAKLAAIADELRYEDPAAALALLKPLSSGLDSSVSRAIGSTFRLLELDKDAGFWLVRALRESPRKSGDEADCLRRLGILRGPSAAQEGLGLLERAGWLYDKLGMATRKTETDINRAAILITIGALDESLDICLQAQERALSPRYRVALCQYQSRIYHSKGKLGRANKALEASLETANVDSYTKGHLLWTAGRLRNDRLLFQMAIEAFGHKHLYHAINTGLELCRRDQSLTVAALKRLYSLSKATEGDLQEFRELIEGWLITIERFKRPVSQPKRSLDLAWKSWRAAHVDAFYSSTLQG